MSRKKKIALGFLVLLLLLGIINRRWVVYLLHLAKHQAKVILYKEKITERLKRVDLPPGERAALEATARIRRKAEALYGLQGSTSYQSFFDLGRKELGFNITIAPALSLKPESFDFWPIGSFDYLGFFDKAYAESWAHEYRQKGFDVDISEIGGYSTLGWFEDPLYSSQLTWGEPGLARLLSHEIAHERLYFKGDTTFSELLASFIERKAAQDYLKEQKIPVDSHEKLAERRRRRLEFIEMVMALRKELENLYAGALPDAEKLRQKNILIQGFGVKLQQRLAYFEMKEIPPINNATLAQFHRYTPQGKAFENLYAHCQKTEPQKPYECWFAELEKLKPCTNRSRKAWLEGDGKIDAAACKDGR
jgi:predicted aminopeptidase